MARKPYTVQKAQEVEPMDMGFSLPITFFSASEIAPDWDTSDRDAYLRSFWRRFGNDMVQAVLAACVAKIQTQNWEIEGPKALVEMYHPILRDDANFGKGYGDMISRGVIDYYTQDNGWFMERQRAGPKDHSGPMLGIAHLDSARMRPTGNQDFPYTYHDVYGAYHLMHRSQFIRIVDMPDSRTELHGWDRGFCALSRALSTAIILMMLITLKREKLSDLPPSALAIFNNLNRKQFEKAIALYGAQEDMKANTIWRQLMPLFGIDPAHPAAVQFLSLREVWESFDDMTAMNIAAYSFAAAWRVDPREFWPVSQGPLGTGKEAEVQHQKAKAKSTGLLFTEVERSFNARDSLPEGVTWKYVLQDADEEQQRALIHQAQISNVKLMQEAGAGLVPDEVRWMLATQYKILPQAMLKAPEEGEEFDLAHADVYLDDVERQAKEYKGWYWGPMVRMDQDSHKSIVNQIGYKLPPDVMFLGDKGGPGSGNWGHVGRPGLVGGSGGGAGVSVAAAPTRMSMSDIKPEFVMPGTDLGNMSKEVLGWGSDRGEVGAAAVESMGGEANGILFRSDSGELIGALSYYVSTAFNENVLHIEWLATKHPGIGRASMGHVAQLASDKGLDIIRLQSAVGAVGFYEKIGMRSGDVPYERVGYVKTMLGAALSRKEKELDDEPENGVFVVTLDEESDGKELNGNLTFGSKELLEVSLKEQFPCCESHAFQLFPDIVHDLFLLKYLTLPQMCKASMAPSHWVFDVSQAIPAIVPGQDVLEVAGKEIARALGAVDFKLGDKAGKALQTINQKIAALPAPIARTVRDNAKRLQTALGASTKRRLEALKGITDEEWAEAVAQDELDDQPESD